MQFDQLKRRNFIMLLSGAVAAWPLAGRAQQPAMPVIGYLGGTAPGDYSTQVIAAFRAGLSEIGFVEGQNVGIEFRWAEGQYDRLPALAAELVSRGVAVIVAGSLPSALAAKQATSTIPIVFVMGADPVKLGVVASLNRPGGNVTGVYQYFGALGGKRLELIRELVPSLTALAVLSNPKNPNAEDHLDDIRAAARAIDQKIDVFHAGNESEIEAAFAGFAQRGDRALLVADDPFFFFRRDQIVALAARHGIPASYYARAFAGAGGLMSYGSSNEENNREAGIYVGRILKGAKPADLPVLQPTKFELVINLKTAKAIGLDVPLRLQQLADEIIE
jgi:putative tryptophan/tyrosine transport system substrate-binding protein